MTSIASSNDDNDDPRKKIQESDRHQSSQPDGPPPLPVTGIKSQDDDDESSLPTIFVSIASYRDSETYPTIQSLFSNAKNASRVKVGLVLQYNETQDASIWNQIVASPWYKSNQIRCLLMDDRHALGPCYARSLCQSLFRDEAFVMQTDSHMRFRPNWDEYLVQTMEMLMVEQGGEKVLLTAYPVGYQLPNNIPNETRGTLLVPWKFDSSGMLRQRGRLLQPRNDPVLCNLYAAGFNFGPARMLQDVPYDQSLHHLFFGEEMSMAVRLYTHGYNLFAPPESVCYHLWSRDHRPTKPDKEKQDPQLVAKRKEQSLAVVMNQLSGKISTTVCGLGTVRTVAQFEEALRVDFGNKTLMKGCEDGNSQPQEFVDSSSSSSVAPDSLEAKVASLDAKALERIAFFLRR
jgi:[Skp1-protein]-hydroxyproline N-acetylglucosaminyltransferase